MLLTSFAWACECECETCFFKFGFRHELFRLSKRGVNKEQQNNKNKSEKIVWGRIPTPALLCLWKVPPPTHIQTHTHTHANTHSNEKVFFHSHHHRYAAEVLQRALATHKVAKSLPFCVTAGNNTYTCLADSFCRSPLCIRMKSERRGLDGLRVGGSGFFSLLVLDTFLGQCGQKWRGTSDAQPERGPEEIVHYLCVSSYICVVSVPVCLFGLIIWTSLICGFI